MKRIIAVLGIIALAYIWTQAPRPTVPVSVDVLNQTRGLIRNVTRQDFATQPAHVDIAWATEVSFFPWMRTDYTLRMVGTVTGSIDASKVHVSINGDAVTVTLPPVDLRADVDIAQSEIIVGTATCPDFVCKNTDRFAVFQSMETQTQQEMLRETTSLAVHTRNNAVQFYTDLLRQAAIKGVVQ